MSADIKYRTDEQDRINLFNLFIEMIAESERLSDEAKSNEELIYECEDNDSKPLYLNIFDKNAEAMYEQMKKFEPVYRKVYDAYHKPALIYKGFAVRLSHLHIAKMREIIREEENAKIRQEKLF
jgi:hypothetical protein